MTPNPFGVLPRKELETNPDSVRSPTPKRRGVQPLEDCGRRKRRQGHLPEDLDPTMRNVWSAFALLYRKAPPAKRDADWIELVKKLFPGKLQIRFSPEDWSAVLARVRSGDVAV